MAISKFGLLFLPGDLVSWPTSLPLLLAGTSDQYICVPSLVMRSMRTSKRSWVMLDKTDRLTDRQTDGQTDRQMKGQSEIAHLPKFVTIFDLIWSLALKNYRLSDYTCGPILVTIGQKLWLVSRWTQYIMEHRWLASSSPCDVISDVFIKKYICFG